MLTGLDAEREGAGEEKRCGGVVMAERGTEAEGRSGNVRKLED